jgi:hypothetical protein
MVAAITGTEWPAARRTAADLTADKLPAGDLTAACQGVRETGRGEGGRCHCGVTDCPEDFGVRGRLADEGGDAGFQGPEQYVVLCLGREYDDAQLGVAVAEFTGQPESVGIGQGDVQHHDVRTGGRDECRRLGRKAAFTDDGDLGIGADEPDQSVPRQRVAVDDDDSDRALHGLSPVNLSDSPRWRVTAVTCCNYDRAAPTVRYGIRVVAFHRSWLNAW